MSATPANEPPPAQPDFILTEKQEKVRMCLWPCLKTPLRLETKIHLGEISLAVIFDRTTGIFYEDIKVSHDGIRFAAKLDPAVAEVDFEGLKTATGLGSAEEAAEVLVHPRPPLSNYGLPNDEGETSSSGVTNPDFPRLGGTVEDDASALLSEVKNQFKTSSNSQKSHSDSDYNHDHDDDDDDDDHNDDDGDDDNDYDEYYHNDNEGFCNHNDDADKGNTEPGTPPAKRQELSIQTRR